MSEKPLADRLQVKGSRRLAVLGASAAIEDAIGPAARGEAARADVVLLCVESRDALQSELATLLPRLRRDAILWVAYPKLGSRHAGDLNRDIIRAAAPSHGLDTVAQIAINNDWSALRLKRVE